MSLRINLLVILIALGFVLRLYHLDTDLLFHRDQGLHSLAVWNIWHDHKLTLLGHPSDVDGLYHAPVYYYLILPAYALSGGHPVAASLFQITLEMLSLPFFFFAIKKLFNPSVAWIALILYTFSYGLISYSRWLVNVTPIIPFTHLLLFVLAYAHPRWTATSVFASGLITGIITQLNAAVGIFLLPLLLILQRKNLRHLPLLLLSFLLPALPLLLFEFRHGFIITKAILSFSDSQAGLGISLRVFTGNFAVFITELSHLVSYRFIYVSSALFLLGLYLIRRLPSARLIYLYLFIPFLTLSLYQRGAIPFFLISLLPLALAIAAHTLSRFPYPFRPLLVLALVALNLSYLPLLYRPTNALIPIGNQNLITLKDRQNILDWMYSRSDGQPFALWTYTRPYFQEEVWQYLFLWYGHSRFGYQPEAVANFSRSDLKTSRHFFAVYEPDPDQPYRLSSWLERVTAEFGPPIETYSSHGLTVTLHRLD